MSTEIAGPETDRPLRRDAARNRELILETAAAVFAEHGLEAGYDEIARRAGIGVGTVYRRFPERAELVQALFESRVQEIVAIAEDAAAVGRPWDALVTFLERTVERQVVDRGLAEVMASATATDEYRTIGRERLGPIVERMVERAQADGSLRADVAASDIGVQLMLAKLADDGRTARPVASLSSAVPRRPPRAPQTCRPCPSAPPKMRRSTP
ncbi:TetR/AcrR family transcriptional regulator [Aeromicrobium sp. UC242_57]|uniref:TetR/AcrR family transcriptional regulator n=1 Tax=Aeromicrobium sp. UC242_57 TaxID=3374624 RepID=UPI00378E1160